MNINNKIGNVILGIILFIVVAFGPAIFFFRAYAWESPQLTANCAPDETHYSFSIVLQPGEPDYIVDFNWDDVWSNFHNAQPAFSTDFGSAGSHDFITGRGGSVLWARFQKDTSAVTSQSANGDLCVTPSPTPTSTPTSTPTPTQVPTQTPNQGSGDGGSDGLGCGSHDCSGNKIMQGAVLGLSTTSGGGNLPLAFVQLFGALLMVSTGFIFFRKNA